MTHGIAKETFHYGQDHVLQTVSVTTLPHASEAGYWVIYIHGGAWRDPLKTSADFSLTESLLLTTPHYSTTIIPHISAFASIEYRLSAHPDYPQDRSTTSPQELRDAKHPDHIHDVESALALLQRRYGFGDRFVLVGHSCGATLAFQSVMGTLAGRSRMVPLAKPRVILGVAGIYDCRLLRDRFEEISAYQDFLEGAFGKDEGLWDAVSPAKVDGADGVEGGWEQGRLAVVAYSQDDELVDTSQAEVMRQSLVRWEKKDGARDGGRRVSVLTVSGAHDEIWDTGEELARAIAFTFEEMQKMGLLSSA